MTPLRTKQEQDPGRVVLGITIPTYSLAWYSVRHRFVPFAACAFLETMVHRALMVRVGKYLAPFTSQSSSELD